jgi:hypothetical protein
MNTGTKAAGAFVNQSGRMIARPPGQPAADQPAAPAKKKAAAPKPKPAPASKTRKAAERQSRAASKAEKLVCRYCGSDDLAPSFKKRRDARCRACFKKRYGSAVRGEKAIRTRKAKAAK